MALGSVFGLTRFGLVGLTVIALSATCSAQLPTAASRAIIQTVAIAPLAQAPAKPGIIVVVKNATELFGDINLLRKSGAAYVKAARDPNVILGDVELLFVLADKKEQYKTLFDNMVDLFLTGVDPSQPLVVTGWQSKKVGSNEMDMATSVPIPNQAQFNKFKNALKDLDIKAKPAPGPGGVFPLGGKVMANGFLRYSAAMKYAHLATNQADLVKINQFSFDPKTILGNDDIVLLIDNSQQKPAQRKQDFARIRKETLGTLKKKAGEAQADFDLRKLAFDLQFNELERFFVESTEVRISLNTDVKTRQTNISISLKAQPGTSLADSIEMASKTNAFYPEITVSSSVVQMFLNFPIDAMRKKHIQDYVKLARPRAKEKIMEDKNRPEAQKQIDADIADLMLDVLEGFGGLDSLNGFLQMVPTPAATPAAAPAAPAQSGKYAVVGSSRLSDGKKFADGVKKLADREPGKVKLNIETVGKDKEISIHSLHLPNKAAKFPQVFGKDEMIFIATSPKSMWFATGENALKTLKDLIEQSEKATSKPVNTMIKLDARVLPFIEILDSYRKANPPPAPPPPKPGARTPKPKMDLRKTALETFANGKDVVHLILARDQALTVKIQIIAEEGILTYFGKVAANFVKETLE